VSVRAPVCVRLHCTSHTICQCQKGFAATSASHAPKFHRPAKCETNVLAAKTPSIAISL